MRARMSLVALAICGAACRHGTRPEDLEPARSPNGVTVAVRVRGEPQDRLGELLAVDSAGVTFSQFSEATVAALQDAARKRRRATNAGARDMATAAIDAAALRRTGARVVLVPWERLDAMALEHLDPSFDVWHGERPSAEKRERIALVSRFPQGIDAQILARLLALHHQDAVERVR